jgi:hypothetical protein
MTKRIAIFIFTTISFLGLNAQETPFIEGVNLPTINSPFSRLGMGNINGLGYGATSSMGGITTAYRDPLNFNDVNPASLGYLRQTAFEAGLYMGNTQVDFNGSKNSFYTGNLRYLALGFPTKSPINESFEKKKRNTHWSMGFSLTPFSQVGYNIKTTKKTTGSDSIQQVNYFSGYGSTYKLKFSNSIVYKNTAFGLSIGYLFGSVRDQRQTVFSNINNYNATIFDNFYRVSGLTYDLGVQYDIVLSKKDVDKKTIDKHIVVGASFSPSTGFSTVSDEMIRTQNFFNGTSPDTLLQKIDIEGKGSLPSGIHFGVMYEKANNLKVGFQYNIEKWSQYFNNGKDPNEKLKDASSIAFGLEYVQDPNSYNSNAKKIRYRLGFNTGKDPRTLNNGEQLSFYNASLGFGIPLKLPRQQSSFINLGFEYGKIGTTTLKENYWKINLGFLLNDDSWFLKRKYD